jgi:hypothetical protein
MAVEGKYLVWTMSAADYYTLRAAAADPRKDAVLGTVRWTIGGKIMEETPSLGWWVDIDVVLDHVGKPVNPIRGSMPSYSLVTWDMLQRSTPGLFPMKPDDLIGFSRAGLSGEP